MLAQAGATALATQPPTEACEFTWDGAELAWVDAVLEELRAGTLTWTATDFASAADAYRLN